MEDTFSIKQISQQIGLSEDTIRYYEKIELLPKVKRNDIGYRAYSLEDRELLNSIVCLKNAGMTLDQIKQYAKLNTISERYEMLLTHKKNIEDQMSELQRIIEIKLKAME